MTDTSRGVSFPMHFPPPSNNSAHPRTAPATSRPPMRNGHGRHAAPPAQKPRWALRIGLTAGLFALLLGGAAFAKVQYLPTTPVVPGLSIDGTTVPEGAAEKSVDA